MFVVLLFVLNAVAFGNVFIDETVKSIVFDFRNTKMNDIWEWGNCTNYHNLIVDIESTSFSNSVFVERWTLNIVDLSAEWMKFTKDLSSQMKSLVILLDSTTPLLNLVIQHQLTTFLDRLGRNYLPELIICPNAYNDMIPKTIYRQLENSLIRDNLLVELDTFLLTSLIDSSIYGGDELLSLETIIKLFRIN